MSLKFGKHEVERGKEETLSFFVGRLPSGQRIFMKVFVFAAEKEGPTCLLTAGIHGDEINGMEILRRSLKEGLFNQIEKGAIVVIPHVNIFGFNYMSREVPDGKDVNRSFPGNMKGSLASRLARIISKNVLPEVDFGIDFHTGSAMRFNAPQIRYTRGDKNALELAKKFNCEIVLESSSISKSLRQIGKRQKKSILVFEGGEASRMEEDVISYGQERLNEFLINTEFIKGNTISNPRIKIYEKSTWIRAADSGILVNHYVSGQSINKDAQMAKIFNINNQSSSIVKCRKTGIIIGHQNAPLVHAGDALFHIAYQPKNE